MIMINTTFTKIKLLSNILDGMLHVYGNNRPKVYGSYHGKLFILPHPPTSMLGYSTNQAKRKNKKEGGGVEG